MTISSETNRSGPYFGNGVTTIFDYDFRIDDESHIRVVRRNANGVESDMTLGADYSVTGVGEAGGGTIIVATPLAEGEALTFIPNVPFTQEIDLENQGAYYAETVERALDLAAMRDLQMKEELSRAVKVPPSADAADLAALEADIIALSGKAAEIAVLAGIADDVTNAVENAANITTVAGIAANVSTVAGIASAVSSVVGISGDVEDVAEIAANVSTVAGVAEDVTAVAAATSDMTAVLAITANLATVAGIDAEVSAVASVAGSVATVAGINADVSTVAGASDDVATVAGVAGAVSTVADIAAAVVVVAAADDDVATVAAAASAVSTVAGSIAAVSSVATNMASVTAAEGHAGTAATAATAASGSADHAQEWAAASEPVSVAAGGDGSTTRSAKWQADRAQSIADGIGVVNSNLSFNNSTTNPPSVVAVKNYADAVAEPGSTALQPDLEEQTIAGGASVTPRWLGGFSSGTVTPNPGTCPLQYYTNDGAHTLAPGEITGSYLLDIINGEEAGAITLSGWTKVTGDPFTTTEGDAFRCHVSIGQAGSLLVVQAMQ